MRRIIRNLQAVGALAVIESGLVNDQTIEQASDAFSDRRSKSEFRRVLELPKLDSDSLHEWKNTTPMTLEDMEVQDIDALAWYQPYSDYGQASWGIYFDSKKMNAHARQTYAVVKGVRSLVSPKLVHQVVWDEVMRHEIEHAVQEVTAATLSAFVQNIPSSALGVYGKNPLTFEALATHFKHTDTRYRSKRGAPGEFEFIRTTTAMAPKLPGYRDWNRIDIKAAEDGAYGLPMRVPVSEIADYVRKSLKQPFSAKFLEIPVYVG